MSEKILISRSGRLGDMVMVAPAVREIIKRHPNAEFTFFTSPDGAALFRNFDSRIVHFLVNGKTPLTRRLKWIYFYFKLKNTNFDLVYCLDSDWRIRSLLEHSAHKLFKPHVLNYDGVVHAAVKALHRVGKQVNDVSEISIPFIPVKESKISELNDYLERNGISNQGILVGLNPSFSGLKRKKTRKYKLWSPTNWALLADKLHQYGLKHNKPVKVVIYSLPKDRYLAEEISSLCKYPPTILTPKADLEFFEAFLSRLDLFIGPDTGGTHLAAGLGTDLITLFAVTDPYNCGPVLHNINSSVIQAENKGSRGINLDLIKVGDVFKFVEQKLKKKL
jgi:heptosyltransferase-1